MVEWSPQLGTSKLLEVPWEDWRAWGQSPQPLLSHRGLDVGISRVSGVWISVGVGRDAPVK